MESGDESTGQSLAHRMRSNLQKFTEVNQTRNANIFWVPQSLKGIGSPNFGVEPEIVSIGPYHHDKEELIGNKYKWQFLSCLFVRNGQMEVDFSYLIDAVSILVDDAKKCYSDMPEMSTDDFIKMMIVDCCFIIEIFQQVFYSTEKKDSLIFQIPCSIPTLRRDLLKLENQLPFFVLECVFNLTRTVKIPNDYLLSLALNFFDHGLFRSRNLFGTGSLENWKPFHLLHLFHSSYYPSKPSDSFTQNNYQPLSDQSMPCVTSLRLAGIKFRPRRSSETESFSFLEIDFHKDGVLEIPPITIDVFTAIVFINCAAFEQGAQQYYHYRQDPVQYSCHFSEYIAFMSCLIDSARDVTFLCDDGIITNFFHADSRVAKFFKNLGENVVFNVRECYLSREFREVEAYYGSNWATFRRTYFKDPWTLISAISASLLLVLTLIQALMAILSYKG